MSSRIKFTEGIDFRQIFTIVYLKYNRRHRCPQAFMAVGGNRFVDDIFIICNIETSI